MKSMIRAASVLLFGSTLLLESQPPPTLDPVLQAAAQLAARTSSLLKLRTVSLDWRNLAALPAPEWSSFRNRLEQELRKAGVETVGAEQAATPPESRLRVTVSRDAHGLLFIAEVPGGDDRQVVMLPWAAPAATDTNPGLRIVLNPLLTLSQPILDLLRIDSELVVLTTSQITRYRQLDGKWTPQATLSLALTRPMPRDPRGRLEPTVQGFRAYLPVGTCEGTLQPEFKLACSPEIAVWQTAPVRWLAGRNVLEGTAPSPSFGAWGSDTATMADPCGPGTITIATSPNNEHDSLRAYQIGDGRPQPVSDALPVPGSITALWPSPSGQEAALVVHNLQTGEYEASRLGLACNR